MTAFKGTELPAAPSMLMEPVPALKVIFPGPSSVLLRVIGLDEVVSEAVPDTLTIPEKLIAFAELIELLRMVEPEPFWLKAPEAMLGALRVNNPVLEIVIGPDAVVVTGPLNVNLFPVKEIPLNVFVLIVPARVVVPVPAI